MPIRCLAPGKIGTDWQGYPRDRRGHARSIGASVLSTYRGRVDAFAWGVVGSVAAVAGTVAVIVFLVIPLVQARREARPPSGEAPLTSAHGS